MTEKYTPEKVAELIAESRVKHCSDCDHFISAMGTALTAVSAERDRLDESFDRDLPWRYSEVLEQVKTMRADRDRLHKAITEALAELGDPDGKGPWLSGNIPNAVRRILRAALDKEGNDDE